MLQSVCIGGFSVAFKNLKYKSETEYWFKFYDTGKEKRMLLSPRGITRDMAFGLVPMMRDKEIILKEYHVIVEATTEAVYRPIKHPDHLIKKVDIDVRKISRYGSVPFLVHVSKNKILQYAKKEFPEPWKKELLSSLIHRLLEKESEYYLRHCFN